MGDRLVALPGCLIGSWRGIQMHMPDVSTPAGRQIVSIALPGTDITLHEDLGLYTGPIPVIGLVVGDDYVATAKALQAACEMPGPGTLVHPWLGPLTVVLKDPAEIRFEADKLRCVLFRGSFEKWSGGATILGGIGTLDLIGAAADLLDGALGDLLDVAVDLVADPIGDVLGGILDTVEGVLDLASIGADLLPALAETVIDGVGLGPALDLLEDAVDVVDWCGALFDGLATVGVPLPSPAIGVGPLGRAIEAAVAPLSVVSTLLDTADALAGLATSAEDEGVSLVRCACASAALSAMTAPLAAVDWESKQQAMAARGRISEVIGTVGEAVIAVDGATADDLAARRTTWQALSGLRRTIHQDLDDRIGRLPSVMTVTPPTRVSSWIVAQHLFGDDPKAVLAGFEDISKRNGLAHPSICDVETIEALPQ